MNETSIKNESDLIQELKNGSREAFNKIYAMYSKRLYGYCLKIAKNREDAEEIVQDVFLRLWNMKAEIRQEETVRSLLFIISKNYLIKSYYKMIKSPIFEDYVHYETTLKNTEGADSNIEYEDFKKIIRLKMKKLPETQRNVIELSKLKQYSIKEIAEKLSLSEQTVRNQLSLGLKTLRLLVSNLLVLLLIYKIYLIKV